MSTDRKRAKVSGVPIQEQFVAEGCDRDFLNELLTFYRQYCEREHHDRQIHRIKAPYSQLTKLASKMAQVQRDIEQLFAEPLHVLSGRSLAKALPFLQTQQKLNAPQHFEEWPALARSYAENWKGIVNHIVKRSGRKDSPGLAIKMIYVYCCNATHKKIPCSRLADLLCEATVNIIDKDKPITEGAVREHLRRTKLPEDQEWAFAHNLTGAAMRKEKVWDFTRKKWKEQHDNKA